MTKKELTGPEWYEKQLKSKNWLIFTEKVKRLKKYTCQKCGVVRTHCNGVELHTHHIKEERIPGRKPWQYWGEEIDRCLRVLCKKCHLEAHPERLEREFKPFIPLEVSGKVYIEPDFLTERPIQEPIVAHLSDKMVETVKPEKKPYVRPFNCSVKTTPKGADKLNKLFAIYEKRGKRKLKQDISEKALCMLYSFELKNKPTLTISRKVLTIR